jgi:hypothetical protein
VSKRGFKQIFIVSLRLESLFFYNIKVETFIADSIRTRKPCSLAFHFYCLLKGETRYAGDLIDSGATHLVAFDVRLIASVSPVDR